MAGTGTEQDRLFEQAVTQFGSALGRLASGYEANAARHCDLVQDIQIALWRSFAVYDGRCSLKTWVYRVAHNRATSHMLNEKRRAASRQCNIEDFEFEATIISPESAADEQRALAEIRRIIATLHPPDRQIMLLYLEDLSGAEIAEITGVSAGTITTKISRFKMLLKQRFSAHGDEE